MDLKRQNKKLTKEQGSLNKKQKRKLYLLIYMTLTEKLKAKKRVHLDQANIIKTVVIRKKQKKSLINIKGKYMLIII